MAEGAQVDALAGERDAGSAPSSTRESAKTGEEERLAERFSATNLAPRLEGRLALPARLPTDESLHVYALECEYDPAQRVLSDELGRRGTTAHGITVLDVASVDGQGAFSLELPKDAVSAWLFARGRYCASPKAIRRELGDPAPVTLELELGAWLTGRVTTKLDVDLQYLSGLSIELEPVLGGTSIATMGGGSRVAGRSTKLSDSLTFEFFAVAAGATYELRGVPADLAAFKSEKFALAGGERRDEVVGLTRGGSIAGRVVDETGQGVPGVELEAELGSIMFGRGGMEVREKNSDANGDFVLPAVAAGKLTLKVSKPGFLELRKELQLTEGEARSNELITLAQGRFIAGRVLWPDGTPAADADVDVEFDPAALGGVEALNALHGSEGDGETDAQGHFRISGLGKGPFVVEASARAPKPPTASATDTTEGASASAPEGEAVPARPRWKARVNGVRPPSEELQLRLEQPLVVTGSVTDVAGAGLDEFRVLARRKIAGAAMQGLGADRVEQRFHGQAGRFELGGLYPGDWEVLASAPGYSPSTEAQAVQLPLAADAAPLVLVLERAACVEGRVVDSFGQPVAGAAVSPRVEMSQMTNIEALISRVSTNSQADGSFRLENLPMGAHNLVASKEGHARSAPLAVEAKAGETVRDIQLILRVGGTIRGEIYGKQGKLASGRMIMAQNPSDMSGQRMASSDSDGRFAFEHVEEGDWQVVAIGGESSEDKPSGDDAGAALTNMLGDMKFTFAKVVDGEEVFVQLGAPPADPVRVVGQVSLSGKGQEGLMMSFVADGRKQADAMKFTTTGKDGQFDVVLPEPGSYLVTAQRLTGGVAQQQSCEQRVDVPKAPEHRLDVELPLGRILGRVRDTNGPCVNTRISLWNDGPVANGSLAGGNYAEVRSDAEGRFELGWLRPGEYVVAAGGSELLGMGKNDGLLGRQVRAGIAVGEGQTVDGIDFKLAAAGTLEGVVRGGAGVVSNATVFVRDEHGNVVDRMSFVQSDAGGRFAYRGLAEGTYSVWARDASQVSTEVQSKVVSGTITQVDLRIDPGTLLVVSLSNSKDEALDCTVAVLDSSGKLMNGVYSLSEIMSKLQQGSWSSKEQQVGPLVPGKYKVIATTKDGQVAQKPVQLSAQQGERKVNLRLGQD